MQAESDHKTHTTSKHTGRQQECNVTPTSGLTGSLGSTYHSWLSCCPTEREPWMYLESAKLWQIPDTCIDEYTHAGRSRRVRHQGPYHP